MQRKRGLCLKFVMESWTPPICDIFNIKKQPKVDIVRIAYSLPYLINTDVYGHKLLNKVIRVYICVVVAQSPRFGGKLAKDL